jgi:hypothetical protein
MTVCVPKRRCWVRSSPIRRTPRPVACRRGLQLLCLPTLSTHGYEVITSSAVGEVTDFSPSFCGVVRLRSHLVNERLDDFLRTPLRCAKGILAQVYW